MNEKKSFRLSAYFMACALVVFIISMFINQNYFEAIAHESVVLYEIKQALAIFVLFLIGFLFAESTMQDFSADWKLLFSFPLGICVWVITSYGILLSGIPYTMALTLMCIACLQFFLFFIEKKRHTTTANNSISVMQYLKDLQNPLFAILLGAMLLCSTGFLYVLTSYDSFFYFINYGRALTVFQSFNNIAGANSFTLTNITQFLPILCSYTAFWGLDQAYQIQAFLSVNVVLAFYFCLSETLEKTAASPKKARIYSILFAAVLATSTSFLVTSGWFLANMPCMAYIFLLYVGTLLYRDLAESKASCTLLIAICFSALALLRKDGIIFDAFFLIWMGSIELFSKKRLLALFTPAALLTLSWLAYVRLGLHAQVTKAYFSSIANNKNIIMVVLIIAACYAYILIGHTILQNLCAKVKHLEETDIMYGAFLLMLLYIFISKTNLTIDNFDYTIRNMFQYPSSWGISGFYFGFLFMFSLLAVFSLRGEHFVWIGFALLNLASYCFVDSKAFWINWDDSYNRVLMQIVPVFMLIVAKSVYSLTCNKKAAQ